MPKNAIKVLAVIVIWATAGILAWHYYTSMFPDLRPRRQAPTGRPGSGAFRHPDPEIQDFANAAAPSSTQLRVRRAANTFAGSVTFDTSDAVGSRILVGKNMSVAEAYAYLAGYPPNTVTQLPADNNRWSVFARSAKPDDSVKTDPAKRRNPIGEFRRESAARFLDYLHWESKDAKRPVPSYRFRARTTSDTAAQNLSLFAGDPIIVEGDRFKPPLGAALNMASRFVVPTTRYDTTPQVAGLLPVAEPDGKFRVRKVIEPDRFADYLAALYQVSYDKRSAKIDAHLVFHPKYTKAEDLRDWEDGKPVTPEEKAWAEDMAAKSGDKSAAAPTP